MENKNCESCKHYVKHYFIFKNKKLMYARQGHCGYDPRQRKMPCGHWEQAESEVSEQILGKEIKEMKRRLDEIVMLLKIE